MTPVLRMPISLTISAYGLPYSNDTGTGGPRLSCQSTETGDKASASKAYTELCMVDTNATLRGPLPGIVSPLTYSGCE